MRRHFITIAMLALATPATAANILPGTSCPVFPSDSIFHRDISALPKHARSAQWMSRMQPTRKLHPDFGNAFGEQPIPYGIPYTIVTSAHAKVSVQFDYSSESDHVGYPLGNDTKVEGGQYTSGDRHTVVIDKDTCRLYETWATRRNGNAWRAGSGATWLLKNSNLRPAGWTSADAAGLPILPLLLRYEEVANNTIDHAIRFTTDVTDRRYLWPARHQAGSVNDPSYPPMGAWFRLRAGYNIAPNLRTDTRRVLLAMKKYGMVLADNGSPWFFQATSDARWPDGLIEQLKQIPASAFEAVDVSSLMINGSSMKAKPPAP